MNITTRKNQEILREALVSARVNAGMTQREAALATGTSQGKVSRLELAKVPVTEKFARELFKLYGAEWPFEKAKPSNNVKDRIVEAVSRLEAAERSRQDIDEKIEEAERHLAVLQERRSELADLLDSTRPLMNDLFVRLGV